MMKHWCCKSLLALAAFAPLTALSGCVVRAYPAGEVVVDEGPPPVREEIVGVAPGPDFIWIGGRWWRDHDRWAWEGGRWGSRPHAGAVWVGGRWDHRGGRYVWHEGRWH